MQTISSSHLLKQLPLLQGKKVLIIGDLVLDQYVTGTVDRISPEAPVPVVAVEKEQYLLGGAGNVAHNIASLGGQAVLAGICGQDEQAAVLHQLLEQEKIHPHILPAQDRPTTIKTRIVANNQQIARVDRENSAPVSRTLQENLLAVLEQCLDQFQVLVLSDYGKGLITREFINMLHEVLEKQQQRPEVFVDPKTKNFPLYTGMNLLTPNTKEASEGAGIPVHSPADVVQVAQKLFGSLGCKNLLITLGPQGMALFRGPEDGIHIPTAAQNVFDVTGAGDTVIATLALARAADLDLLHACALANGAAGIVVGTMGTAAVTCSQLERFLQEQQEIQVRPLLFPE